MNKLFKQQTTIITIVLILACIASCSNFKKNQAFKKEQKIEWINFEWYGDSISGQYFDKLAIYLPFSIEGIPHKFKSQFDLGAKSTMVYENSIKPYLKKYSNATLKLDTINTEASLKGENITIIKNVDFKLDTVLFKNQKLEYLKGFGNVLTSDSIETKTVKHIGTIGPNIFQEKYLIIDFPNERIAILDSLNNNYKKRTRFVNIKLEKGRIKVPVNINGISRYFMFDTGSSIFPLSVSKEDVKLISKTVPANDTLKISSWGEYYDIHGYKINSTISIGGLKLETKDMNVYDSKKEFKEFFEQEEIMGIMGNSFFLDKEIIIDYKNQKFGIVN